MSTPRPRVPDGPDEQSSGLRSLDLVQRVVASALTVVVLGSIIVGLSAFSLVSGPELFGARRIGVWIMIGVVGLVTAMAVLVINQRRPYAPWVVLGLVPMAVVGLLIFT